MPHNQGGIAFVALPAKIAAMMTVIDQPLIVKRNAPILSILSCRICTRPPASQLDRFQSSAYCKLAL